MRIVSMGELLIDFVALENGVTVGDASGFQKAPGGAPANVAVAVARLGTDSAFIGQVGDDAFGHYLADVLKAEGVDVRGLRFSSEARTMLAFVSLRADGERSFMFYRHPSADMLMTPADVVTEVIAESDIFHFGSITLISSPAREATLTAAQFARDQHKLISYDPNLRLALWDNAETARAGMRLGLEYAHIVKVSEEEVDYILLEGETLNDWWDKFPQLEVILLTHGAAGSRVYLRNGSETEQTGFSVQAVDTTGAGDSFVAGVLVGILEQGGKIGTLSQLNFASLLRFANATAAITTTQRGAIPALPRRSQVNSFVDGK